jgi:hypothetical protein
MTSQWKARSNRRNSQSSSGPSPRGAKNSARNSTKHGLSGTKILSDGEQAAVDKRYQQWLPQLRPVGPRQEWVARQIVAASVRIDVCGVEEDSLRQRLAARAALDWQNQLKLEAATLAMGLSKNCEIVAFKLRLTYRGTEWILARLRMLADVLKRMVAGPDGVAVVAAAGGLEPADRERFFDLIGLPAELRRGPTVLDLPEGSTLTLGAHQLDVIQKEIGKLVSHNFRVLKQLDESEQSAASSKLGLGTHNDVRLYRRYAAEAEKRRVTFLAELKALQQAADADADAEPWEPDESEPADDEPVHDVGPVADDEPDAAECGGDDAETQADVEADTPESPEATATDSPASAGPPGEDDPPDRRSGRSRRQEKKRAHQERMAQKAAERAARREDKRKSA